MNNKKKDEYIDHGKIIDMWLKEAEERLNKSQLKTLPFPSSEGTSIKCSPQCTHMQCVKDFKDDDSMPRQGLQHHSQHHQLHQYIHISTWTTPEGQKDHHHHTIHHTTPTKNTSNQLKVDEEDGPSQGVQSHQDFKTTHGATTPETTERKLKQEMTKKMTMKWTNIQKQKTVQIHHQMSHTQWYKWQVQTVQLSFLDHGQMQTLKKP